MQVILKVCFSEKAGRRYILLQLDVSIMNSLTYVSLLREITTYDWKLYGISFACHVLALMLHGFSHYLALLLYLGPVIVLLLLSPSSFGSPLT